MECSLWVPAGPVWFVKLKRANRAVDLSSRTAGDGQAFVLVQLALPRFDGQLRSAEQAEEGWSSW
jgi:hypothetical protein